MIFTFNHAQQTMIAEHFPQADIQPFRQTFSPQQLSLEQLVLACEIANACYRAGEPLLSDADYDQQLLAQLKTVAPEHPFLQDVEPELVIESKTVALPQRMLSTDKAYTLAEIERWIERLVKAANDIEFDVSSLVVKATPKLDGYAAYDDGERLYTRGDGYRGQDISRAFTRGLQVAAEGERGLGAGEIVTDPNYFEQHLSEKFENPRNIQAAVIAEKNVDPVIQQTIDDGACVFYPFPLLPHWQGSYEQVIPEFDAIVERISSSVPYDIDGVIFETTVDAVKAHLGATRKFHRWQIAFKSNVESAEVKVLSVTPQTSRTGRISPVAELEPTKLSGATLSRATVHHYGMVKSKKIGAGSVVELVRSGLVIPKIERVITPAEPEFPERCPSCDTPVLWEGDHLICPNTTACPAQAENTMVHFFKTLGNADGFGPKVIEKIYQSGVTSLIGVYQQQKDDFVAMGFGEKTSENLVQQLLASRSLAIEDWRFLAAFGVNRLGPGNCERLLQHHAIAHLFDVSVDDMVAIDGFAELSATAIHEGLLAMRETFFAIYDLGFNLSVTQQATLESSPISGKTLVFTGTMTQGSRGDMEKQAKTLGAKVSKSVSAKTDYLVAGEKVGATKLQAAEQKGVEVLTEQAYLSLINAE